MRHKVTAFNQSKDKANNSSRKEGSSPVTRDLNDLFATNKKIRNQDFTYTKNLTTMIAVVPKDKAKKWEEDYETLNDYIIPRSIKEFEVKADIGSYKLMRIVLLRRVSDEVAQVAKDKYDVILREYEFDAESIMKGEQEKKKMVSKSSSDKESLKKTCIESFKDIYSTYAHIKVLKVAIDSQMRFGTADDYCIHLIQVNKGRDKKIHDSLINVFAEPSRKDLYGTKEATGDNEDYFPDRKSVV